MDRMLEVRAERRAERRNQYTTNIEVGLVAALLVTLLAFQLPISSTSPSGWIQERLEEQQMAQAELPPRPTTVESVDNVILEAEPVTLDATLELDLTAAHPAHRSTDDRSERPSTALR